jgi:hypothetical protein
LNLNGNGHQGGGEARPALERNIQRQFQVDSKVVALSENERLLFAKQVLVGLALICTGIFVSYACYPANEALRSMFELVKIGALPIVTLLISF